MEANCVHFHPEVLSYRSIRTETKADALLFFCDVLSWLCAEAVDISAFELLEQDVHCALALLERTFLFPYMYVFYSYSIMFPSSFIVLNLLKGIGCILTRGLTCRS